jgi:hypothetical protein
MEEILDQIYNQNAPKEKIYEIILERFEFPEPMLKIVEDVYLSLEQKTVEKHPERKCEILIDNTERWYECSNSHVLDKLAFDEWVDLSNKKVCVTCGSDVDRRTIFTKPC